MYDEVVITSDGYTYWVSMPAGADIYQADEYIFHDGFESGDLTGWSGAVQ